VPDDKISLYNCISLYTYSKCESLCNLILSFPNANHFPFPDLGSESAYRHGLLDIFPSVDYSNYYCSRLLFYSMSRYVCYEVTHYFLDGSVVSICKDLFNQSPIKWALHDISSEQSSRSVLSNHLRLLPRRIMLGVLLLLPTTSSWCGG
jgi:hypothetical protein